MAHNLYSSVHRTNEVQVTVVNLSICGLSQSPISEVSNEIYILYKLLQTTKRRNSERNGAQRNDAQRNDAEP